MNSRINDNHARFNHIGSNEMPLVGCHLSQLIEKLAHRRTQRERERERTLTIKTSASLVMLSIDRL
jgi:hypothetical protein